MAQADSVPSSTRQLITGESANQSTNLPAIRVKPSDRRHFIGGLGSRASRVPIRLLNRCWYGASTGKVPKGSGIDVLSYALRLLRKIFLAALPLLNRHKRLHFRARQNAVEKTSSKQLVRSKPQGRLK
jgi:hypothetical protein